MGSPDESVPTVPASTAADDAAKNPSPPAGSSTASKPPTTTWRLPEGIEDHVESGLVKLAAGVAVGGLAGLAVFRGGGKGWRTACAAAGAGVALGSTYERASASYCQARRPSDNSN